jgi:hypothetical protein
MISNQNLDHQTPEKTTGPDSDANTILCPIQRVAPNSDATELNEKDLHYYCHYHNCQENPVVEKVSEDVDFVSKLTAVDLVENLHENETLEQDCVVCGLVDL